MTSPDGIVWTQRITPGLNDDGWASVCWSPELGLFVAVGISSDINNRVITSPDGINWTTRTSFVQNWNSICWSPELRIFVAVSSDIILQNVMTSPDGIVWTLRSTPYDNYNDWFSVCWSPELGIFVAVGYGSNDGVMTSPDGINWTTRNTINNNWRSVCWSPELGIFVAVGYGSNDRVITSPDGINWTSRTAAVNNDWREVCWSPQFELFVAVSSDGSGNKVMTSPNGINWTTRTTSYNGWLSVCWSPELGIFVAVAAELAIPGTNDAVMTSSLLARPPTSYNVFDSSFNNIDQSGNWTFKTKSIYSDGNITIDPSNSLVVAGNLDMSGNNVLQVNNINLQTINGQPIPTAQNFYTNYTITTIISSIGVTTFNIPSLTSNANYYNIYQVDTTNGPLTINLPSISTLDNDKKRIHYIVDSAGQLSNNNLIIGATGGNTIGGQTSATIVVDYSSIQLVSNTDNKWLII
jgi:hypothetical protein